MYSHALVFLENCIWTLMKPSACTTCLKTLILCLHCINHCPNQALCLHIHLSATDAAQRGSLNLVPVPARQASGQIDAGGSRCNLKSLCSTWLQIFLHAPFMDFYARPFTLIVLNSRFLIGRHALSATDSSAMLAWMLQYLYCCIAHLSAHWKVLKQCWQARSTVTWWVSPYCYMVSPYCYMASPCS
jgi:hypothetical protein